MMAAVQGLWVINHLQSSKIYCCMIKYYKPKQNEVDNLREHQRASLNKIRTEYANSAWDILIGGT
ncbi:MAG: hypothetical protein NC124_16680 [Clostridium sp.]|nr:hypothetical protein [Clostridium sp.]